MTTYPKYLRARRATASKVMWGDSAQEVHCTDDAHPEERDAQEQQGHCEEGTARHAVAREASA